MFYFISGLQEYIEALSFYHYCKEGKLISWQEVSQQVFLNFLGAKSFRQASAVLSTT